MTKSRITSFFQVTKSIKRGSSGSVGGTTTSTVATAIPPLPPKRPCPDSTLVGTIESTGDIDPRIHNVGDHSATITKRPKISNRCDEVQQLLKYLEDDDDDDAPVVSEDANISTTRTTWKGELQQHFDSLKFQTLSKFVTAERTKYTVYPPPPLVWSALNACPLHHVKVVIVGQDPYHGPNQAHGVSFSVLPGCPIPPSLKNIYKELMEDPNISNFHTLPAHGSLIHWVKQGVLLLNAVMTVREKEPNSHQNKGWENVTDEIIRAVLTYHCTITSNRSTDVLLGPDTTTTTATATMSTTTAVTPTTKGRGCVFLLWGKPATKKAMHVIESVMKSQTRNLQQKSTHAIICTSHPSPLGARKTSTPFLGSHCFSRCNEELIAMGHDPIDWTV